MKIFSFTLFVFVFNLLHHLLCLFLFLICCIVEMSDKEETEGEPPPSDTSLANNVARLKDLGTGHDEDYIKKVLRQTSNNVEVKSN